MPRQCSAKKIEIGFKNGLNRKPKDIRRLKMLVTYRLSNHIKHPQPFEILKYQMRLTFSLKSHCRDVVILIKRPHVLMNMSITTRYGKQGRRTGRKKRTFIAL